MTNKLGFFILDLQGQVLTPEEEEMLAHPMVGGVILFVRNYASRSQLTELCAAIRAASERPLLIMVDQEGGRVQRFQKDFTRLPPMGYFRKAYDKNPIDAQKLAKDCGWLMAVELLSAGLDLSLAPVLDLDKGKNSAIGNRAFHSKPLPVIHLAQAFIAGMREAGMAAVGKHFPGHGEVSLDSHLALPIDHRSFQAIESEDLLPFTELAQAGISGIMAAHIVYPAIDDATVGFSHKWLKDILRKRLGFNGVILSDDLNMEGANISGNYAKRVEAAKEAGCDFVLLCNNRRGVMEVLDQLVYDPYLINEEKWSTLQASFLPKHEVYTKLTRWQETHDVLLNEVQYGND